MKCVKCGKELSKINSEKTPYLCETCGLLYEPKDIEDMLEAEKIEEDTKIWKECQKFH
ncbi:MAG: hypothetical protein IKP65_09070 [Alphaproteobacteria bacterium]|nr:hypothetical protein [Alphaproteobacteria bacterium]